MYAKSLQSCPTLCNPMNCSGLARLLCPWDSPGKNTGVGCHALLQQMFPIQGLNPGLLNCRQIPYCLSHQGSPGVQFSSVAQSCPILCNPMDCSTPGFCSRLPCPSPTPRVYSHSCPLSQWCHLTISTCYPLLLPPSIIPSIRVFSNESVLHIRWPSIRVSASASVIPINIQDLFPLGWTSWISLQSKGLSRVFSNTTIQKPQFFGAQLSL